MNRTNQILSLILVAQVVLAVVIFFPRPASEVTPAGPLLADFNPADVTGLVIRDNSDHALTLGRTESGEWMLPEMGSYPVLASRVEALLNKLAGLTADRLIARNPSSQNRLQVAPDNYQRLLEIQRGENTDRLYIGTSVGTNATHMRVNDASEVYLTSGLAVWEIAVQVSSWVDTLYFNVQQNNVVALRLENANGVFEFTKQDDAWTLAGLAEGETFNPDSFTPLLRQASQVRMAAPLGREDEERYGLADPQAVITLTVMEEVPVEEPEATSEPLQSMAPTAEGTPAGAAGLTGELLQSVAPTAESTPAGAAAPEATAEPTVETVERTYTWQIGAQLEEGGYAVISSESEYYVRVAASAAETLLNVTRESLLVTPEAEATPAEGEATPTP